MIRAVLMSVTFASTTIQGAVLPTEVPSRPSVQYAHHSAADPGEAFRLFNVGNPPESAEGVRARAGTEFVRVTAQFSKPLALSRVSVQSCGEELSDGAEFFFHPGLRRAYRDVAASLITVALRADEEPVTSFAIHFRHHVAPCLSALRFYDAQSKEIVFDVPKTVSAKIESPEPSASRLFDSRVETFGKFSVKPTSLSFEASQTADGFVIVNGNQASEADFRASTRLTTLTIAADKEAAEVFKLSESKGAQAYSFAKPISAKKISFASTSGAQATEIRLRAGARDIIPFAEEDAMAKLREAFTGAGLNGVLDRELDTGEEKGNWLFRFRGDGSFFLLGKVDDPKNASTFVANGVFEITNRTASRITLRLRGERVPSSLPWDGWRCGFACGERDTGGAVVAQDLIQIQRADKGRFMIRNRTPAKQRSLPFTDLTTKISTLAE